MLKRHPLLSTFLLTFALVVGCLGSAVLVGGCSTLGQQSPQSTEDSLRYSQGALAGVYRTIGDLSASKIISLQKATAYYERAEQIEQSLNAADAVITGPCLAAPVGASAPGVASCGDPNKALAAISVARSLLLALAAELEAQRPKPVAPPASAPA